MAIFASLLLFVAPTVTLIPADEVILASREVRLGDVAHEAGGALGRLVIARLPEGLSSVVMDRQQVVSLVRRTVPGAAVKDGLAGQIRFNAPSRTVKSDGRCFEMLRGRSIGEPIAPSDVRDIDCPAKGMAALRYDAASGRNVASAELQPGDVIAAGRLTTGPSVRQGQRMVLASRAGPVVIERPVTALQSARPNDGRIFVRTDDGETFAAPIRKDAGDE